MVILAGTGIKSLSHITREVEVSVQQADKVLYLVNEPVIEEWILKQASETESMHDLYIKNESRRDNYRAIIDKIIEEHEVCRNLCVLIYGHPTVFAYPGIEAIRQIERKGGVVKIMPGISAEDCLFADLRVNPGERGCLSIEATEFLLYDRVIDPMSHVIFWQIGQVGNTGIPTTGLNNALLDYFCRRITEIYGHDKEVVLYEASLYPNIPPKIRKLNISLLKQEEISTISSLYLSPEGELKENKMIRGMMS